MITLSAGQHAVYRLSFSNGKKYIGVTNNLHRRLTDHRRERNKIVGKAINKYGNPEITIFAICEEEYAYALEQRVVDAFNTLMPNGYNLLRGGTGGRIPSLLTRKRQSAAKKGKSGHPHTEASKRKIGEKNRIHGLGRKMPIEIRQKISVALTGKKKSSEHRANISKARLRMNVKSGKVGEFSHG